jgi:predicted DNA-binding transcriptional regulator AlpA
MLVQLNHGVRTVEDPSDKPRDRYLDTATVQRMIQRKKTRFSQLINDPEANFPRPIKVHARKHAFLESEVLDWMAKQPRVEMKPPSDTAKLLGRGEAA